MDVTELLAENKMLKLQLKEAQQANKDLMERIPKIQAALSKGNMMIYNMKAALFTADSDYKHAVTLFDDVRMPEPIHRNAYTIAALFKQGKSVSEMAEMILGDKRKKSTMHRIIKQTKEKHPHFFKE